MKQLVAAVVASSVALGCGAMSRQAWEDLEGEVAQRNRARSEAALAQLEAKGYAWIEDGVQTAMLSEPGRERCLSAARSISTEPAPAKESVSVDITPARSGATSPAPRTLSVKEEDACAFFRGRVHRLLGRDAAGAEVSLVRISGGLARDPHGKRVEVILAPRRQHREVTVDMFCNRMPSPVPDPLAYHSPPARVVEAPAPLPRVNVDVEEEVIDVECTDTVY
ncbi:MAG: hypothetical protein R3B13_40965 [Polyangiaceae bacterium]